MRFETFETHRTDVKIPYSAGLLVVRTDLKLSKHRIHRKLLYSGGRTDSKLSKPIAFM